MIRIGVDEVGRGALAGPVIAAAVILPYTKHQPHFKDSKMLSKKTRELHYKWLTQYAYSAIAWQSAKKIDQINILEATMQAMTSAVYRLIKLSNIKEPIEILIDGNRLPSGLKSFNARTLVKGDQKIQEIAAASSVAKIIRDTLLEKKHILYPVYDFANNKGYGSEFHREAILQYGPCPYHRKTYNLTKQLSLFNE